MVHPKQGLNHKFQILFMQWSVDVLCNVGAAVKLKFTLSNMVWCYLDFIVFLIDGFHFIFSSDDLSVSVAVSLHPPLSFVSGNSAQCSRPIYSWSWFTLFWSVWATTRCGLHWFRHKHGVHVSLFFVLFCFWVFVHILCLHIYIYIYVFWSTGAKIWMCSFCSFYPICEI